MQIMSRDLLLRIVLVAMLCPLYSLAGVIGRTSCVFAQDKTVLRIWDQWEYFGMSAGAPAIEVIHKEYRKQHPHVILERSVFGGGWPVRNALEKAFETGMVPDVFYSWPSGAVIAELVHAGHIADLTPYADRYNWRERLPEWALLRNSYRGKLYAYPWEQDLEYIYYNKRIFRRLGLGVPEKYEDILHWCDAAKKAGYIPIALGNKDLWPAVNMFSDMTALTGGRQLGLDLLQNKAKWNHPRVRAALERILQLAKNQCFTPNFNEVGYYDALADFYSGKATAAWTGSWVVHMIVDNVAEEELGIFYFPQICPDKPRAAHMSEGSSYFIWKQSKVRDLAAEYIDFVTHPRWLKTWIEQGFTIPVQRNPLDYSQLKVNPVVARAFQEGQAMQEHHIDGFHTTAPTRVTDVLYNKLPKVLAGALSIEDFLNEVDEKMATAASRGEVWSP